MWLAGLQILRSYVDNIAADRLSGRKCEGQVLVHVIYTQLTRVDGSLIDRSRLRQVDQFTATKNIATCFERRIGNISSLTKLLSTSHA